MTSVKKDAGETRRPKKFVGLHAHTGIGSPYDGLDYPQDHLEYIIDNGMDAWALTEHGNMNSFGHAYFHAEKLKKAGANFKFIPGCEAYMHPDLSVWDIDYKLQRAAKDGDESARRKLLEQRERLATPLTAIVDHDDDPIDVIVERDDEGLTIENEDETKSAKSSKFYDPVKRRHHLVVLPKTSIGLERLFHLTSRGYMEGFYRFPRIDFRMIKEAAKGGHLLLSSACIGGAPGYEVFKYLQEVEFDELKADLYETPGLRDKVVRGIANVYDNMVDAVGYDDAYLELQFNKLPAQHLVNRALIDFAKENGIEDKLIVTCDSHYSRPEHWKERELYKKLGWLNYENYSPDSLPKSIDDLKCELYPKNAEQVWETYKQTAAKYDFYDDDLVCDAIERTHDIAHHVIGDIKPDTRMKLPDYVVPKDKTEDEALLDVCKEGLIWREVHDKPEYIDRLKTELKVIKEKNFSKYFLTMKAIMDIAREHMLIGPGRGSAAGSLVAWILGITNIDPIEHGLLFARFLSIHRTGAPDIDSDIADRDQLIGLLRKEFGDTNVIPISNYNTFKLKSLVKDISRFYGIEFDEVNRALGPVERDVKNKILKPGQDKNMFVLLYEDAYEHSKSFRDFIDKYPHVAEPIQILFKQNRSLGRHAGGLIISDRVGERMPLIKARGELQTPWVEGMNYKHLESLGWIKFDLLGLETLRIIHRCIELILQKHQGIERPTFKQVRSWFDEHLDPKKMDLNDPAVYEKVYQGGDFAGVFQLMSKGARRLFMQAKPDKLIDIATLTSVFRPGPLAANVHNLYIKAKRDPDAIDYGHPLIKQVLEPTYGTIVFQEQLMQLCSVVAGFPEEDTDQVRRFLLKRKASEAQSMFEKAKAIKDQFVNGAVSNGVNRQLADDLYEKMLFFAGYGFNKSHAISYGLVSYYCAWLLTYYEEEWSCAYLDAMSGDIKKLRKAIGEVKAMGYTVVPIDVNYATRTWTILPGKRLMPSLNACKGVGASAAKEIMRNRPYASVEDFLWDDEGKWKHSKCNKSTFSALIRARAFDSLGAVGEDGVFNNYQQMHDVIINNWVDLRKSLKTKPTYAQDKLKEAIEETQTTPDFTPAQVAKNQTELFGAFDAADVVDPNLMKALAKSGIESIDEAAEQEDVHWFVISKAIPKLTKNGRPYLLLEGMGESGLNKRVYCWGWDGTTRLEEFSLVAAQVKKNDFGYATQFRKLRVM